MRTARGVGLLELMIGVAIVGLIVMLSAPTFGKWLTSLRIRSAAESMLSGIQFARSEATTRNSRVRFQITDTLDSSCQLSTTGLNWVVDAVTDEEGADSVLGACDAEPSEVATPHILQLRSASEGGKGITVLADEDATELVFNGLGRLVPAPGSILTIKIMGPDESDCRDAGGELTCLHIQVSPTGQIRMCNPIYTTGTDPQAC